MNFEANDFPCATSYKDTNNLNSSLPQSLLEQQSGWNFLSVPSMQSIQSSE